MQVILLCDVSIIVLVDEVEDSADEGIFSA
jgi:hypothetical protein